MHLTVSVAALSMAELVSVRPPSINAEASAAAAIEEVFFSDSSFRTSYFHLASHHHCYCRLRTISAACITAAEKEAISMQRGDGGVSSHCERNLLVTSLFNYL